MILKIRPVERVTSLVAVIRELDHLDIENGPWVAGGAGRAVFLGENLRDSSDIDVFSSSYECFNKTLEKVKSKFPILAKNKNKAGSTTFSVEPSGIFWSNDKTLIQVVGGSVYPTVDELFKTFDFTICQFATDGHHIVYTESAENDLNDRVLRVESEYQKKTSRPSRLLKYIQKGFTPAPGVLTWTCDLENRNVSKDMTIDAEY